MNDADLLAAYVSDKSEEAFKELVRLHVGMVYSVCRRQLKDAHWAEDVTQAVFVLLARKAEEMPADVVVGGWLYRTAVYACSNARSLKRTRTYHEKLVMPMKTTGEPDRAPDPAEQAEMEALLDEGLMLLSKAQREVLVLRFFESRAVTDIARMRKQSLYATQKALDSGLARLRRFMKDRGVPVTAGIILAALLAESARATPAGLAGTVGSAALSGGQSAYVAQLAGYLSRQAGRAKLLGVMGIAAAVMVALALWVGVAPFVSASGPGMAARNGAASPAPVDRDGGSQPGALTAQWNMTQQAEVAQWNKAHEAELTPLWETLHKAERALRAMDVPAIGEVVAFTNAPQKANWDEMVPVFARNQALKQAGLARFGKDGANLTAIKTFGERLDEILPQIDPERYQWTLGDELATLYFAYRGTATPGGAVFFIKENGRWKIDAGMSVDVALQGLDGNGTRVAMQELDEPGRILVHEKMGVLTQSMTQVAQRIAAAQAYDLETAQRELAEASAPAQGRAFFRLTLRYDNAGQVRN